VFWWFFSFTQSDRYTYCLTYTNYAFAAFFTLEALFKVMAYGRHYFLEPWDLFDFIIMAATNIGR
jgi:voltage-gated sodium channel type II alpha